MVYMYNNAASGIVPVSNEVVQVQQGNNGEVKVAQEIVPSANSEVKSTSNDSNAQLLDFNPSSL